jgi:broad specificity phosphatase PhoE
MKLFLVRHGQTEWNLVHRIQGQLDSPLTELGRLQADRVGAALAGVEFSQLYCSDSGRAMETVERIRRANPDLPMPCMDVRLRELDYGDWEGVLSSELEADNPGFFRSYINNAGSFKAPNGESFTDLQNRFSSFLSGLKMADDENCLIVSHGGLIRVALLVLTGKSLTEFRSIDSIEAASISRLEWTNGSWTLLESSGTKHLEGIMPE